MKFLSCKPIGLCVIFTIFQKHLCWVTQDVTAGCGALCAPQWHSVHSHQWHRPPTAACHYSAFNHLLEGERVCGWGLKQQWLHLSTSGHFCCHQISVFMGHNVDSSFFFFSSLGTKPQKASKCFSFCKEKEACLWMIFDSVLAHSIKGLGKTFKSQ